MLVTRWSRDRPMWIALFLIISTSFLMSSHSLKSTIFLYIYHIHDNFDIADSSSTRTARMSYIIRLWPSSPKVLVLALTPTSPPRCFSPVPPLSRCCPLVNQVHYVRIYCTEFRVHFSCAMKFLLSGHQFGTFRSAKIAQSLLTINIQRLLCTVINHSLRDSYTRMLKTNPPGEKSKE